MPMSKRLFAVVATAAALTVVTFPASASASAVASTAVSTVDATPAAPLSMAEVRRLRPKPSNGAVAGNLSPPSEVSVTTAADLRKIAAANAATAAAKQAAPTSNGLTHGEGEAKPAPPSYVFSNPTILAGPETRTPIAVEGDDVLGGAVFLLPQSSPVALLIEAMKSAAAASKIVINGKPLTRFDITLITSGVKNEAGEYPTNKIVMFSGLTSPGAFYTVAFTKTQVMTHASGLTIGKVVNVVLPTPSARPIIAPVMGYAFTMPGIVEGDYIAFKPMSSKSTTEAQCGAFCASILKNENVYAESVQRVTHNNGIDASYDTGPVESAGRLQVDCACIRKSMRRSLNTATNFTPSLPFTPLFLDSKAKGPIVTNDPPLATTTTTAHLGDEITLHFKDKFDAKQMNINNGQKSNEERPDEKSEALVASTTTKPKYNVTFVSAAPYSLDQSGSLPLCTVTKITATSVTCKVGLGYDLLIIFGIWSMIVRDTTTGAVVPTVTKDGASLDGRTFAIIELPRATILSVEGTCAKKSADCEPRIGTLKVSFVRGNPGVPGFTFANGLVFTKTTPSATPIACDQVMTSPGLVECTLHRTASSVSGNSWHGVYNVDLITRVSYSPDVLMRVRLAGTLALGYGAAEGFGPESRVLTPPPPAPSSPIPATTIEYAAVGSAVAAVAVAVIVVVVFLRRQRSSRQRSSRAEAVSEDAIEHDENGHQQESGDLQYTAIKV